MQGFGPLFRMLADLIEALLADRGYDADPIRDTLAKANVEAVIPAKRHRRSRTCRMERARRRRSMTEQTSESATYRLTSVDDLAGLRSTLETWIDRAADAVWNFHVKEDGSFWNNSTAPGKVTRENKRTPHITTTARCYIALLYAHRARGEGASPSPKKWVECFDQFTSDVHMTWEHAPGGDDLRFEETAKKDDGEKGSVNTFDVAHLADFIQVADYVKRFRLREEGAIPVWRMAQPTPDAGETSNEDNDGLENDKGSPQENDNKPINTNIAAGVPGQNSDQSNRPDEKNDDQEDARNEGDDRGEEGAGLHEALRGAIIQHLNRAIGKALVATDTFTSRTGEVQFDTREESAHYFATLHALRALHALDSNLPKGTARIVEGARAFGMEQCFYYQRGMTHRQDAIRLAFACSIYAIYGEHVDQDLCLAMIEALHEAQQENGSWPASHPIQRENGQAWRIASHEVALCLTWLYFQPKVPDAARPLLIEMMRRYLVAAVAPTFFRAPADRAADTGNKLFNGWQDDHTVGTETTVGWATAIICHFLANFSVVLDDWINRQVIEDLGLALSTERYRIDDIVSKPAKRWQREFGKQKKTVPTETSANSAGRNDAGGAEKPGANGGSERNTGVDGIPDDDTSAASPVERTSGEVWPDLPPHAWARTPADEGALAASIYEHWTDPIPNAGIAKGLAKKALLPILDAADQRPKRDSFAALIPGEPGTRKTSLVDRVADVIIWPKVAVPASLIFADGFDRMEAQANYVFERLNHLRRCVIFFDEFEEFFVSRQPDQGLDVADTTYKLRTIAAFTTSAMLPRLQQLHDVRRCLIFLATNHLEKLDSAIKRRGRFDFQILVNHPTASRLAEYLGSVSVDARERAGLSRFCKEGQDKVIGLLRDAVQKVAEVTPERSIRFAWAEEILRDINTTDTPKIIFTRLAALMNDEKPDDPPLINVDADT